MPKFLIQFDTETQCEIEFENTLDTNQQFQLMQKHNF